MHEALSTAARDWPVVTVLLLNLGVTHEHCADHAHI